MKLLNVHHAQITVPKGSEDRAREFYCGLLGLAEIAKPDELKGRGGFWLELGGFQIHVGTEDDFDRSSTKAHLGYIVDDLDECRKKLLDAGLETFDGVLIPHFRRFEFRDPFGNRVEFLERI